MGNDRNPEVLKQWAEKLAESMAGARLVVAGALVDDTFSSRRQAAEWFLQRGGILGSIEAEGCLVVLKR